MAIERRPVLRSTLGETTIVRPTQRQMVRVPPARASRQASGGVRAIVGQRLSALWSFIPPREVRLTPGISCERPIRSTLVSFIPLFGGAAISPRFVISGTPNATRLWSLAGCRVVEPELRDRLHLGDHGDHQPRHRARRGPATFDSPAPVGQTRTGRRPRLRQGSRSRRSTTRGSRLVSVLLVPPMGRESGLPRADECEPSRGNTSLVSARRTRQPKTPHH